MLALLLPVLGLTAGGCLAHGAVIARPLGSVDSAAPAQWRPSAAPVDVGGAPEVTQPEIAAAEPLNLPKPTGVELDLRIGAIQFAGGDTRTTVGARLGFYPWKGNFTRRLGVHIGGDYVQLDKSEGSLPGLRGLSETATYWYTFGTALGVDVIRTPRFVLDARFGVVGDVTETRFALEGDDSEITCVPGYGCSTIEGDGFVDVCDLSAFRDRCSDDTRAAGTLALGVRVWPVPRVPWFIGVEYTRLTTGRSQILATIGVGPGRR